MSSESYLLSRMFEREVLMLLPLWSILEITQFREHCWGLPMIFDLETRLQNKNQLLCLLYTLINFPKRAIQLTELIPISLLWWWASTGGLLGHIKYNLAFRCKHEVRPNWQVEKHSFLFVNSANLIGTCWETIPWHHFRKENRKKTQIHCSIYLRFELLKA